MRRLDRRSLQLQSVKNITVFITPALAHVFADDRTAFLKDLTLALLGIKPGRLRSSADKFTLALIVVDGLGYESDAQTGRAARIGTRLGRSEGFAILLHSTPKALEKMTPSLHGKPREGLGLISVFNVNRRKKSLASTRWTIEAANTLFLNGKQHHILVKKFSLVGNVATGNISTEESSSFSLILGDGATPLYLPLRALTPQRRIESSMGNVISKLAGDTEGKGLPASSELETAVAQLLSQQSIQQGTFQVFALVSPTPVDCILNKSRYESIEVGPTTKEASLHPRVDSGKLIRAFEHGAHLHKVTSGGGGWGNKQGLLSLNPDTDLMASETSPDDEADLEIPHFASDAAIAIPGQYVQFFANLDIEHGEDAPKPDGTKIIGIHNPGARGRDSILGDRTKISLSTIDASESAPMSSKTVVDGLKFNYIPRSIILLTEGKAALALSSAGKSSENAIQTPGVVRSTRLDVPNLISTIMLRPIVSKANDVDVKSETTQGSSGPNKSFRRTVPSGAFRKTVPQDAFHRIVNRGGRNRTFKFGG